MRLPNSYGSIVKLSGKRRRPFAVRITTGWTDEGRQIQKYLSYHKRRSDAMAALAEYNKAPFDLDNQKITFAEMYERWLSARYNDDIPKVYAMAYKRLTNLFHMPFITIRKRHIQEEINNCKLSVSAKAHMKTVCSLIYKYAIDMEIVTTNQALGVTLPTATKSDIHQPFSTEEVAALWEHTDDFAARIALVLIYTGLRPSELLTIRTENVHIDQRYMVGGLKTAAGRNRTIPIADKILPFIQAMYHPDNKFLVTNKGRQLPYSTLRYHWDLSDVLKSLPNRHLPHDGRHTCASMLANAGVDLKIIQLILGHSSKSITEEVYTHKTLEQLITAINLI